MSALALQKRQLSAAPALSVEKGSLLAGLGAQAAARLPPFPAEPLAALGGKHQQRRR